jgi:hypothetical protein
MSTLNLALQERKPEEDQNANRQPEATPMNTDTETKIEQSKVLQHSIAVTGISFQSFRG